MRTRASENTPCWLACLSLHVSHTTMAMDGGETVHGSIEMRRVLSGGFGEGSATRCSYRTWPSLVDFNVNVKVQRCAMQ